MALRPFSSNREPREASHGAGGSVNPWPCSLVVKGATLEPGEPVPLFQTRIAGRTTSIYRPQYDVAPDSRFLVNAALNEAAAPITLLMNWQPEAKK